MSNQSELNKISNKIKDFEKKLDSLEIEKDIGEEFKNLVKKTFVDKKSPFGKSWIPSSNPDTLVDTGALKESVVFIYSKNKIKISADGGLGYGRQHNNGLNNFPVRQFMPNQGIIPNQWREIANNLIEEKFKEAFK